MNRIALRKKLEDPLSNGSTSSNQSGEDDIVTIPRDSLLAQHHWHLQIINHPEQRHD